jgi:hypothetical protein
MSPSQGSLRYELGAWLTILLQNSGLTATDVAREMRCSVSKVSRMTSPTASRVISYNDARSFLDAVGCSAEERERFLTRLDTLLRGTRISEYRKFHTPADWTRREAVSAAPIVRHHGLSMPTWLLPEDHIARWIRPKPGESMEAFTGRQRSMLEQATEMLYGTQSMITIIGEELLDRAGADFQCHLLSVANRLGVHVYPYSAGWHRAMASSYTICRWPNSVIPDALFEESLIDPVAYYDTYTVQVVGGWFEELLDLSLGGTELHNFIEKKLAERGV